MKERTPARRPAGCLRALRFWNALVVVGILLLAANLRPALTSVAPLIGQIRAGADLSNATAGSWIFLILTAIVISFLVRRLLREDPT